MTNPNDCPKSPDRAHEPSWPGVRVEGDGGEYYLEVACKHCNREGCLGTDSLAHRITWPTADEEAEAKAAYADTSTTHYVWKVMGLVDGEEKERLLTPHADPMVYEYPIDFLFDSPEAAVQGLKDWELVEEARDEGWQLCVETLMLTTQPTLPEPDPEREFYEGGGKTPDGKSV